MRRAPQFVVTLLPFVTRPHAVMADSKQPLFKVVIDANHHGNSGHLRRDQGQRPDRAPSC